MNPLEPSTLSGLAGSGGFSFNSIALPLFTAGLAAVAVILIISALFSRPKTVVTVTGERKIEASDLEKFFLPLFNLLIRRRKGGRAQLERELLWTRSRFKPEAFLLLPFILTPAGFVAGFAFGYLFIALDAGTSLAVGGGGAVMGWFFLRSRLNSAMRKRQALIRDDSIDLMGTYASVSVASSDMTTIFAEIDKQSQEERERSRLRMVQSGRMRSRPGPYDGEVYVGLHNMMDNASQGLVREGADVENPDLLINYAIYCNDDDMNDFLMQLRQATIQHRSVTSEQIEQQVRELRLLRIDQIRSSEATQQLKATVYLVFFNLLILFAVIMLPFIAPFIPTWLHAQFGI